MHLKATTSMQQQNYLIHPDIHDRKVAFVTEDDLWISDIEGNSPRRLTTGMGQVKSPIFSSNGQQIAFISNESGNPEIYIIAVEGGRPERQTYTGSEFMFLSQWSEDDKHIYFCSFHSAPFRVPWLYALNLQTGIVERMPEGEALWVQESGKKRLLGRNKLDGAYWKRYRGGTAGDIWYAPKGKNKYHRLLEMTENNTMPFFFEDKICFVSDHEGHGNLYSCNEKGDKVQRITEHRDFYVRFPRTDGNSIVYQSGGNIYYLSSLKAKEEELPINPLGPASQTCEKFVTPGNYLEDYDPHPKGGAISITARGKPFSMDNKTGPAFQYGKRQGVRYRMTSWMPNGKDLLAISDEQGEERVVIFTHESPAGYKVLNSGDFGRPLDMEPSPDGKWLAITNNRYELLLYNLEKNKTLVVDMSNYERIRGISWSADSTWLAYGFFTHSKTACIKVTDTQGKAIQVTSGDFLDYAPAFDPRGKYLYFLSNRAFNPVYDSIYFDLNFPRSSKPFAITLQSSKRSPFRTKPSLRQENNKNEENQKKSKEEKNKEQPELPEIEWEGIEERIAPFPVEESNYAYIQAAFDKVYFLDRPNTGTLGQSAGSGPSNNLWVYDHNRQKAEKVIQGINEFAVTREGSRLVYRQGQKLMEVAAGSTAKEFQLDNQAQKESQIDLSRLRLQVAPKREWRQMFDEAWRLMRDQFWSGDMSGVKWDKVHKQYLPLLEKIATRSELSDLIWEMQGELGTSHAYEIGGEFRTPPNYPLGILGVDWEYVPNAKDSEWKVGNVLKGDTWNPEESSPLAQPGINVKEGEKLKEIDGHPARAIRAPEELMQNAGGREVQVKIEEKTFHVKTLKSGKPLYYREWVEANRRYVHDQTDGKVGYVHIPDMGPRGYAEFHRYYMSEVAKESLIVDVRYNGGGHVSQLLLEKLQRKRIGYDFPRYGVPEPYPDASVLGKTVALTNQFSGSDGDIFTHCFKLMELGPVIGKRTWGGVIGINPRHPLVDGTVTTQPEFSFWFKDVYWGVENYGSEPDIDVDITPGDFEQGNDPQMDKALEVVREEMNSRDYKPLYPNDTPRPDRGRPHKR